MDWTKEKTQHIFSLKEVYIEPWLSRKFRRPFEVKREPLDNLLELFHEKQLAEHDNVRVLLQGLFLFHTVFQQPTTPRQNFKM